MNLKSTNGTHQCIVTVLGPGLDDDFEETGIFEDMEEDDISLPIAVAKYVTAKVICGVAFLHSIGVIHGGKPVCISWYVSAKASHIHRPTCWKRALRRLRAQPDASS